MHKRPVACCTLPSDFSLRVWIWQQLEHLFCSNGMLHFSSMSVSQFKIVSYPVSEPTAAEQAFPSLFYIPQARADALLDCYLARLSIFGLCILLSALSNKLRAQRPSPAACVSPLQLGHLLQQLPE